MRGLAEFVDIKFVDQTLLDVDVLGGEEKEEGQKEEKEEGERRLSGPHSMQSPASPKLQHSAEVRVDLGQL